MITDEELQAAKALCEAAKLDRTVTALQTCVEHYVATYYVQDDGSDAVPDSNAPSQAAIALLPLVPKLLAEVERLRAEVSRWEAVGEKHDIKLREPGCKCHREECDSPCPIHEGDE